jgi:hypothetical protein
MRANDWDPIREKHYGQRLCAPHKQAGHMTAPTNAAATSKKFLPIKRRPHMTQSRHSKWSFECDALASTKEIIPN